MNQQLEDRLGRTISSALKRAITKSKDPVVISELILSAIVPVIDMHSEESGISAIPEAAAEALEWDMDAMRGAAGAGPAAKRYDIPSSPAAITPPPGGKAAPLIAMPGDREFAESKPADLPKSRRVLSALDIQRTPPKRPGANIPERQYWDEATLMNTILENTPEEITFEIDGPDGNRLTLPAVRNVHNQQGMGSVVLTYRHPSVSEHSTGAVTVDLIAKHPFSLYEQNVDIDVAMNGPKGIMAQLEGQYKVRPETMNPTAGPEPQALSTRMLRTSVMQDSITVEGDYDEGHRLVNPGSDVFDKTFSGIRQRNDSVTPQHTQVKRRDQ